jgi:hypothetical protein
MLWCAGATTAFSAIHTKMLELGRMGIGLLSVSKRAPKLVALVAQAEVRSMEGAARVGCGGGGGRGGGGGGGGGGGAAAAAVFVCGCVYLHVCVWIVCFSV